MKKFFVLSLLILLSIFLISCHKEDKEDGFLNSDDVTDENLDLEKLSYSMYLNDDNPVVVITVKDFGVIKLQLFTSVAPISVANFLSYLNINAYDNSSFHRIIKDFMIQGGMVSETFDAIIGEFSSNGITNKLKHERGVISMARTNVNNSATSQFFIVHKKSLFLDGEYAAFGGMISGFDVLDKIASVKTSWLDDSPTVKVVIESIVVL